MTGNRFSLFRRDFNQTLKTTTTTKKQTKSPKPPSQFITGMYYII